MPVTQTSSILKKWHLHEDTDNHDDPLLDCLMLLVRLYGRTASRTGLKAGLPLVDNRLTVELFPRAATRAGLSSRILKRSLKKISNLELPAILLLNDGRACVVVEADSGQGTLKILLPESGMGEQDIAGDELAQMYSGYAIFVRPKYKSPIETVEDMAPRSRSWFWGTLFSSWRIYRDVFIASFVINLLGLATPFFILNVYDRVIPNSAFETLWVLAIGISIIYLFTLLMRALRGHFVEEAGKKANLQLSASLFEKVLGLRMEVRPKSVGSFSKNLQQFESIRDFITSFSITTLIDMPFVILGLIAIWYISGNIVLIHVVAILILLLYAAIIQVPLRKAVEKTFQASAQKNAILIEGLSGIETIKMLGAESQMQRAWEESVAYIAKWGARSRVFSASVSNISNFIQNFTVIAVVVAGVYMISIGDLSQGGLIALVILTRQAVAPMSQVVNLATRFHHAKTALKTLNDIMALPEERPANKSFLHRTRFDGAIELQNVTFSYPEQSTKILNNISLKINAGERVGVIGPIGSGKTTLGKLMLGLYEPISGTVSMDETDIRQIDPAELRHYIGYVAQDVTLFRGTVRENITLGTHDVDDSTVFRAAELAGVDNFVKKHSMGFDMPVEEQGRGLSGGQRQSVALARAILLDPPIIILDEPTSSMDNRTEIHIKTRLAKILKGKTLVLFTHRASLLDLVDRLIVIDSGIIVADGPRAGVLEALKNGQINM
ncbi:MAG: type I secretion system permease/ATPase [Pseudomonadota bacterium]